jgi:hypothetical protein
MKFMLSSSEVDSAFFDEKVMRAAFMPHSLSPPLSIKVQPRNAPSLQCCPARLRLSRRWLAGIAWRRMMGLRGVGSESGTMLSERLKTAAVQLRAVFLIDVLNNQPKRLFKARDSRL